MKEFERDSKLPFWVILGGEVIACFATLVCGTLCLGDVRTCGVRLVWS